MYLMFMRFEHWWQAMHGIDNVEILYWWYEDFIFIHIIHMLCFILCKIGTIVENR